MIQKTKLATKTAPTKRVSISSSIEPKREETQSTDTTPSSLENSKKTRHTTKIGNTDLNKGMATRKDSEHQSHTGEKEVRTPSSSSSSRAPLPVPSTLKYFPQIKEPMEEDVDDVATIDETKYSDTVSSTKQDPSTTTLQQQLPPPPPPSLSSSKGTVNKPLTTTFVDRTTPAHETTGINEDTNGTTDDTSSDIKLNRLSRLVEALKKKIDRLQEENTQLEEMLAAADATRKTENAEISRLQDALAKEEAARIGAVAALNGTLASKDAEVASLREQLHSASARTVSLTESLADKEAEKAAMDAQRSASEGQLIASLRMEVEAAESLLEKERAAHAATQRAFADREHELNVSMTSVTESIMDMQRHVEEKSAQVIEEAQKRSELESEVMSLKRVIEESSLLSPKEKASDDGCGARNRDSGTVSGMASMDMQERFVELEAAAHEARQAQLSAEQDARNKDEELFRMKSEIDRLRRQITELQSADAVDMRRRLQEATEALYQKQSQLERAAADKAAMQLQLERHAVVIQAEHARRRSVSSLERGVLNSMDDGYGVVPMDALGDTYTRLANAPGHLGGAVKAGARLLDGSAVHAVRLLKQYPLGRLVVFWYIVVMHLFIYMLLHRLQHRAFAAAHDG